MFLCWKQTTPASAVSLHGGDLEPLMFALGPKAEVDASIYCDAQEQSLRKFGRMNM